MYRGIEEAGITHVLARHEQGAGFMADGYARATGQPGVAYVITGPGLCNIMTPMGQAYSDSVPMLVISSCLDETVGTRGQLHQMKDQEGAARTVCDWSETARTAAATYALIDRAIMELALDRPRPKHIQVPIAQLEAMAAPHPARAPAYSGAHVPGDVADVVCDALAGARRPLFILGGGARDGAEVWRNIVSAADAASFMTYAGRGIVPLDGKCFGSLLARPASARVIGQADLVIAVGTELAEVDLWRAELGARARFLRVDKDTNELFDTPAAGRLAVDAAQLAKEVWVRRSKWQKASDWTTDEVRDFRARMRAEIAAERPGILPVADALKEALPAETMIYSDMTQFAYAAKEVYPMDRPGHWHHPYGFGTLGYALPAAIGGKIGVGEQPVIAILGDYGFQYTVQELAVAVELGLTLPIIIWDNGKLGEIEDSMVRAQIAPNAVVQRNPDFCKLAEAYGARSAAPADLPAFQAAVRAAMDAAGPTIIHVRSDIAVTSN